MSDATEAFYVRLAQHRDPDQRAASRAALARRLGLAPAADDQADDEAADPDRAEPGDDHPRAPDDTGPAAA